VQNQEETIETFVDLGLTHLQAKTYLTLLSLELATAKEIAMCSNIPRQDVYRLLFELNEKGLVEKIISKPEKFRSIPPNEAIPILLQRKREKLYLLQKKAAQTCAAIKYNVTETLFPDMNSSFVLLSKGETNIFSEFNRLRKAVAKAKKSVIGIIDFELLLKIKQVDEENWKALAMQGVSFRVMTNQTRRAREINLDPALKGSLHFEIRWTSAPPTTSVLLVDEKEVFFRMGLDSKSPVLLSLEPCFVALIKDYLETKWKSLKK
jgi:sugar-specific transcriptional regulator TrmB